MRKFGESGKYENKTISVDKKPACPFCNSKRNCKHLALKIDEMWSERSGGFLSDIYGKCENHLDEYSRFKGYGRYEYYYMRDIMSLAADFSYRYEMHYGQVGMTTSFACFYAKDKTSCISKFLKLFKLHLYSSKYYSAVTKPENASHICNAVISNSLFMEKIGLYYSADHSNILYILRHESASKYKWKIAEFDSDYSLDDRESAIFLAKQALGSRFENAILIEPGEILSQSDIDGITSTK